MFITIIIFVIILGLLVFVHELGHFIMARKTGMKVEEFGIGFPPRLWSIRKGETRYSINWIPLGGFVKITGENGEDKDDPRSFINKKIWKRAVVLVAGVSMNVLLAYFVMIIGFSIGLPHVIDGDLPKSAQILENNVQIIEVKPDTPAAEVGILEGDVLLSMDGSEVMDSDAFQNYIKEKQGGEVSLVTKRGDDVTELKITPRQMEGYEYPIIGVLIDDTKIVRYPWYVSIWEALKNTIFLLWTFIKLFGLLIYSLVTEGRLTIDLSGPVGIAKMTGQYANLGLAYLLRFVSILSLNLAIINLLPFPALDGGKLVFLLIEKIKGSPVNQKIENLIHNFGFMLLIVLIIIVTYRDIVKIWN